jgi:acyl carrier protein
MSRLEAETRPIPAPVAAPSEAAIQAWLVARLSEELGVVPQDIEIDAPFSTYGLDSVAAVNLVSQLEAWLGQELSPTLPYEHTNVRSLARHLSAAPDVNA